jgi:hypothetical protein
VRLINVKATTFFLNLILSPPEGVKFSHAPALDFALALENTFTPTLCLFIALSGHTL